jgi:hypothetical protein
VKQRWNSVRAHSAVRISAVALVTKGDAQMTANHAFETGAVQRSALHGAAQRGRYADDSAGDPWLTSERSAPMATIEEVAGQPLAERLARMERTANDLAAAIRGHSEAVIGRRPDDKNWAAREIIAHLRDTEELYTVRAQTAVATDEPTFLRIDPDRWAAERQYLRHDTADAPSPRSEPGGRTHLICSGSSQNRS